MINSNSPPSMMAPPPTAPSASASDDPSYIVIAGGLATTALALAGVYLLRDVNPMGWYIDYIIPGGALMVGAVAASGYGIASWMTGCKISGRLLGATTLLLAIAYFLAKYLGFRIDYPNGAFLPDGTALGFWAYFDWSTQTIAFEDHGKAGEALGALGYGVRALEVIGFVGGGVLVPVALRSKPYCEPCQRYKRTRALALIPAGLPPRFVNIGGVKAERASAAQVAFDEANASLQVILNAASKGEHLALKNELETRGPLSKRRKTQRLDHRISVSLIACARCHTGQMATVLTSGQGNAITQRPLGSYELDRRLVGDLMRG